MDITKVFIEYINENNSLMDITIGSFGINDALRQFREEFPNHDVVSTRVIKW